MKFPCVGCGACCVGIGHLSAELGEWLKPDGTCIHLGPDNRCGVYETRPTICRVMDIRPPMVSEKTWVGINLLVCDFLHQRRYGEPLETPGLACGHKGGTMKTVACGDHVHDCPYLQQRITKYEQEIEQLQADLAYEQDRNRNNVASYAACLREWLEAESSPDCVACCTLDAALAEGEVKRG